jgi:hypothetical protein
MGKGVAASHGSGGDYIQHFAAIRVRVTGTGNLKPTLFSLDDVRSYDLVDIAMSSTPGRFMDRLSNVVEQRAYLRLRTTEISEYFRINRITIFTKTVATQYPA